MASGPGAVVIAGSMVYTQCYSASKAYGWLWRDLMLKSDLFTRGRISACVACAFLKPSGRVCVEISHESPSCLASVSRT